MTEITPENVQEKLNLFQQMQQQVQTLSQQASQIDMSIRETERTLEEIKAAKEVEIANCLAPSALISL